MSREYDVDAVAVMMPIDPGVVSQAMGKIPNMNEPADRAEYFNMLAVMKYEAAFAMRDQAMGVKQ